jgi:D-glycero-D-manno-heptose 1,7-bisphosphate phosphatase
MSVDRPRRRAVFLDRDGCINAMVYHEDSSLWDSPQNPTEFHLLPGVPEAIRLINKMSLLAVIISNQPGIAKGKATPADLLGVTAEMRCMLAEAGAALDAVYYCLHHPQAVREEYKVVCECRKPKPGLLLRAAKELAIDLSQSYMIGDRLTDVQAGTAAGCRTILLGHPQGDAGLKANDPGATPAFLAADLPAAVKRIRMELGP